MAHLAAEVRGGARRRDGRERVAVGGVRAKGAKRQFGVAESDAPDLAVAHRLEVAGEQAERHGAVQPPHQV